MGRELRRAGRPRQRRPRPLALDHADMGQRSQRSRAALVNPHRRGPRERQRVRGRSANRRGARLRRRRPRRRRRADALHRPLAQRRRQPHPQSRGTLECRRRRHSGRRGNARRSRSTGEANQRRHAQGRDSVLTPWARREARVPRRGTRESRTQRREQATPGHLGRPRRIGARHRRPRCDTALGKAPAGDNTGELCTCIRARDRPDPNSTAQPRRRRTRRRTGCHRGNGPRRPAKRRRTRRNPLACNGYARLEVSERLSLWGLLGYGTGELDVEVDGVGRWSTDTTQEMAAAGARGVLVKAPETGGFELGLRGDAVVQRMRSDAATGEAGNLAAADAQTSRVRLVLEGARSFEVGDGGVLTPTLEAGLASSEGLCAGLRLRGALSVAHGAGESVSRCSAGKNVALRPTRRQAGFDEFQATETVSWSRGGHSGLCSTISHRNNMLWKHTMASSCGETRLVVILRTNLPMTPYMHVRAMMEADREALCGAKGRHQASRRAWRPWPTPSSTASCTVPTRSTSRENRCENDERR